VSVLLLILYYFYIINEIYCKGILPKDCVTLGGLMYSNAKVNITFILILNILFILSVLLIYRYKFRIMLVLMYSH